MPAANARKVFTSPRCPRGPIDKGIAGPGLLAHLLTSKYCDHIPLNRLQGMLRRHRVEISVASLCDWVGRMADLLRPIYDGLRAELLSGRLIQSDDTPVPYQLDTLKTRTATGYLWTYLCESSKLVLYDFTTSHSRAGPSSLLSGFEGTLLTDGHASYNEVVQRNDLIHAGCWAHARRKFYDARHDDRRRCGPMLKLIQELFAVERKAKAMREQSAQAAKHSGPQDDPPISFGDAEHLELRRTESAPLVAEIRSRADAWSVEVLPRSACRPGSELHAQPMAPADSIPRGPDFAASQQRLRAVHASRGNRATQLDLCRQRSRWAPGGHHLLDRGDLPRQRAGPVRLPP